MTNFLTTMRLFSTHDTYHGLATNIMEASVAVFLGPGFHEVSLLSFPFVAVNGIAATAVDAALRPVAEGAMPSALIPVLLLVVTCVLRRATWKSLIPKRQYGGSLRFSAALMSVCWL